MGQFSAKEYGEAFTLLDDPGVDEETKKVLRAGVDEFEKRKPQLAARTLAEVTGDQELLFHAERMGQGIGGAASFGESGLESMRRTGFNKPKSSEQYARQRESLRAHYEEKKELTDTGKRRETFVQPTTMPEETAQEMQEGLRAFEEEHPEEVPPEATPGTMMIGPEGATMAGDVASSSFDEIDSEANKALDELGSLDIDDKLPSASGRKDLYADPEFLPQGQSTNLWDLAQAQRFYEPPIEVARAALRSKLGAEADDVTEKDHAYKRFADAMWQEARAQAEAVGKPIVRVAYMTDGRWKNAAGANKAIVHGIAEVQPRVLALQLGAGKSLTGGISNELMAGAVGRLTGRDVTREIHDIETYHPYLTGGGMVLGAMAPGGAANRVYSALAGKTPSMARAGLAGAGTGAAESVVQDYVHKAGEAAFAKDPHMQGDVGGRAMNSALFGLGGGLASGPIADIAMARVRALREGSLGPLLARAEAGGVETGGISGVRLPEGMQSATREAAAAGRQPVDVMLDRVMDPIAAAALKRQLETVGGVAEEKAALLAGKAGRQKASASPLAAQVDTELSRLFDDTGRMVPVADADRKVLGKLAEQTLEVRLVPAADAAKAVRGFGGGGRRMDPLKMNALLDKAPELADVVRQAQRNALDPAAGAKAPARRGRKRAAPDTERTAEPPTERDVGSTMLPPAPSRGTMPSPPFTAARERAPDVSVETRPYDGVSVTDTGSHVVEEIPGYVYVVGPRKMTPPQLQDTIGRLSEMVDEGKSTDLFKRLRDAALQTRDRFKGGVSAKNTEWEKRLSAMESQNEAAGLPRRMRSPNEGDVPDLSVNEAKRFTNVTKGFGGSAGRELSDDALVNFARAAGKEKELRELGAFTAGQQLREKAKLRGVVGLNRNAGLYSASPGEALGLRADPAMRALASRLPEGAAITPELRALIRRILKEPPLEQAASGARSRLAPIEALRAGQTGLLSARQLGPASGAGHERREKIFINQLPPKERELLLRMVELSQRAPQRKASGE